MGSKFKSANSKSPELYLNLMKAVTWFFVNWIFPLWLLCIHFQSGFTFHHCVFLKFFQPSRSGWYSSHNMIHNLLGSYGFSCIHNSCFSFMEFRSEWIQKKIKRFCIFFWSYCVLCFLVPALNDPLASGWCFFWYTVNSYPKINGCNVT